MPFVERRGIKIIKKRGHRTGKHHSRSHPFEKSYHTELENLHLQNRWSSTSRDPVHQTQSPSKLLIRILLFAKFPLGGSLPRKSCQTKVWTLGGVKLTQLAFNPFAMLETKLSMVRYFLSRATYKDLTEKHAFKSNYHLHAN